MNCNGNDVVTYNWTMDLFRENNTLQSFDWSSYASIDPDDASISIDVRAFDLVVDVEKYAFVLTGGCRHDYVYVSRC